MCVAVPGVEAAGDLADEEGALHAHHEQKRAANKHTTGTTESQLS
jgi:hypothetical protein